jgi:ABC-type transport system involved in cytochrome c biogenesis permease subunit
MRSYVSALGSLKLTVALLLLVGVVLAAGTIVESTRGAEAGRAIYYAPWFFGLQALFALNLLAALWERWPRNRWRIGFAITHTSMVVILAGALATYAYKVEGRLPLWEGQQTSSVYTADGGGATFEIPFQVRLDAFEMDLYPGTRRPAMFRSRVTVIDPATGEQPAVIEMNKPLHRGGYSFFQSSYQIDRGREMSILSVSKDPGQAIAFLGYTLLVLGMIVVFVTRLIQHGAIGRGVKNGAAGLAAALLAGALGVGAPAPAGAAEVPDAATAARLRGLPVQHDGRTMPFDTQAREAIFKVTGKRAWPGIDPVAMAAGWAFDPQGWVEEPVVKIKGTGVAEVAGLPSGTRYASFRKLVESAGLREAVNAARARQETEEKLSPFDKDVQALEERLILLDGIFRGTSILPIPVADPVGAWQPAQGVGSAAALADLGERVRASSPPNYPSQEKIDLELAYNARRPTRVAWILLVAAAIAAAVTQTSDRFRLSWVAALGTLGGFAVITWALAARWQIAGRIPASNMYESMLFLAWGVALFGVISVLARQRMLVLNAAATSALATLLLDVLPIDPFIHPMPPVLSGTPWLAIHVPIIMLGYASLAMVTLFAHLVVGVELFAKGRRDLSERWSQLAYWYTHVGSILLLAGILTGSIWAASSWGRYWGWDPKEVWSLVAFLAYMAILHARSDLQIGGFGVAIASIAAFWTILMTYLGVNFVLASGLHSYGFGSSSLVRIMALIAAVEAAFLIAGALAHRRRLAAEGAKI